MFTTGHVTRRSIARNQARALETWRDAARLVGLRWRVFVEAEPANRPSAFASYTAALDAEEAAATEITLLCDNGASTLVDGPTSRRRSREGPGDV